MDVRGLKYCPGSGLMFSNTAKFKWKPRLLRATSGEGYFIVQIGDRKHLLHRCAYFMMTGALPRAGLEIDHINGNRLDNRWSNLRIGTKRDNQNNQEYHRQGKLPGIRKRGNRWEAYTKAKNKYFYLGVHKTKIEAILARKVMIGILHLVGQE